jgi:TatD DNase family protein
MIDSHAHICYKDFDKDRDEIIERSRKELAGIVVASARHDEGVSVLETCRQNPGFLFPSIGCHPYDGGDHRKVIDLIRQNREEIVAVGEVGLDYHWEKDPSRRRKQADVFREFISLAKELGKPLVVHSWDAEREAFDMVRDSGLTVVFHCFSGSRELAHEIVQVPEFYVSISTQVLFNKSLRKVARDLPLERMLLETDSPFLSPAKMRKEEVEDKRNFPWNIILSGEKIAKLRHLDSAEVLNAARENAIQVFGLVLD